MGKATPANSGKVTTAAPGKVTATAATGGLARRSRCVAGALEPVRSLLAVQILTVYPSMGVS